MQGFHLALFNEVLFEEEIEAWKYGPVISKEYYTFKVYGNNSIIVPETNHSFDYLSDKQKKFSKLHDSLGAGLFPFIHRPL